MQFKVVKLFCLSKYMQMYDIWTVIKNVQVNITWLKVKPYETKGKWNCLISLQST